MLWRYTPFVSLIDPNNKKETGCNNALRVHSLCFLTRLKILISSLKCSSPRFRDQAPWKLKTNRNSFCRNIRKRNVSPTAQHDLSYMKSPQPQSFRRRKFSLQEMINIVDMFDMRKMVDRLDEKVILNLILQVTHSIYAAFANFSAALQLLFILNFRLIITILDTIIGK